MTTASPLDYVVDKIVSKTGSSKPVVKLIMATAVEKLPANRKVTQQDIELALEATGVEIDMLIKLAHSEFAQLGKLKQMLALATVNSHLAGARRELQS